MEKTSSIIGDFKENYLNELFAIGEIRSTKKIIKLYDFNVLFRRL